MVLISIHERIKLHDTRDFFAESLVAEYLSKCDFITLFLVIKLQNL
jgi:hypothetical protein